MGIYQKILAGKIYFPKYFDKNAKALVKKLVTADLSKRYGNLKAGSDDILGHSWFKGLDLKKMEAKEITPPYKPQMKETCRTMRTSLTPPSSRRLSRHRRIRSWTGRR